VTTMEAVERRMAKCSCGGSRVDDGPSFRGEGHAARLVDSLLEHLTLSDRPRALFRKCVELGIRRS